MANPDQHVPTIKEIDDFFDKLSPTAFRAVRTERERCAVLAECLSTNGTGDAAWDDACRIIAAAIRSGK